MRFVILFFILLGTSAFSQDYLITHRGDTLKGSITFQAMGKIEMATVKGKTRETISAINTREAVKKGKRFKPVQFNGEIVFMEILTDGYVSLLAFKPPNVMAYDGRLLQKRDGRVTEVPALGFKKILSNFFSDYPDLVDKIKTGDYSQKDLSEIINSYNSFISDKTIATQAQDQLESTQQSKLELINSLRSEIEKSELPEKQDAIDMLNELMDKIKANKPILPYMIKSLSSALESRKDLIDMLKEITEK